MAYKTILTILTPSDIANASAEGAGLATLRGAIALARAEDAHLDILALGLDHTQIGYFYAGASAAVYQETIAIAQDAAERLATHIHAVIGQEDIRWSLDTAVTQLGTLAGLIAHHARYADLVVLGRAYGTDRGSENEAVVEAALFDAETPVLILPDGQNTAPRVDRIAVAWNQSSQALRAVRSALPLLKRAALVDIVVIDPPVQVAQRADPGVNLTQMLTRHGITAEVSILAKTLPRVSDVLLRHATDTNADLIVMGAYGHSRFREAILGGATRRILDGVHIPVFMAH